MLCKLSFICLVIITSSHFVDISIGKEIEDLIVKLGNPTIGNLEKLVYHFRMSNYVSRSTNIWKDKSVQCMDMEDLCKNLSISTCDRNKIFTNDELNSMLPGLVLSSLEKTCSSDNLSFYQKNKSAVWGYTFGFITLINLCALLGIVFSPLLKKAYFNLIIMMAVSLAVGILSSNSLFNLIPDAFGFDPLVNTDFLYKSIIIIGSIYFFYAFETVSKIIFMASNGNKTSNVSPNNHGHHHHHEELINNVHRNDNETLNESSLRKSSDTNSVNIVQPQTKIATIAWLIIIGDAVHNFADGLAIGSAFCTSLQDGVTTSISVLLEELPHEIGDFALLLNSGMTLRQAAFYNFLSACSCYIGNIFGIITGSFIMDGTRYISAFAGGLFLYISLVNILPECTEKCIQLSQGNWRHMSFYCFLSYSMMVCGITFMYFTAMYSINI